MTYHSPRPGEAPAAAPRPTAAEAPVAPSSASSSAGASYCHSSSLVSQRLSKNHNANLSPCLYRCPSRSRSQNTGQCLSQSDLNRNHNPKLNQSHILNLWANAWMVYYAEPKT